MQRTITLCKEVHIVDGPVLPSGTTLVGEGDVDLPSNWDETEGPCVLWLTTDAYGEIEIPLDAIEGAVIYGPLTDFYPLKG